MTNRAAAYPSGRILFVHAHPDDETLITGGTIAKYVREGADVMVVTCTLGEEGEVIGDEFALLTSDQADQLGGYRVLELSRACSALAGTDGVGTLTHQFLGGAGRWRDSGMAGTPAAQNPRAFVNADMMVAASELAAIICDFQPDVVTTYDPNGTYGHPDHIRAHAVTHAAVELAASGHMDHVWDVPLLYWSVIGEETHRQALDSVGEVPRDWLRDTSGGLGLFPDHRITTRIDIRPYFRQKVEAFRAHATQVTVSDDGASFALSNKIAQPILGEEHFVLARTSPHATADGAPTSELLVRKA
ncbi:N-acetyl-1-D-myo-inositol-2-amino-2-deoxy-alpha-D-glucopyranoside deacetylase [Hoyosella rhizosphaerae]|nr:N-acetyl-1-D-myo-inositol-2-amino-2-deoxy-alpha-D-glucopyranoside deacetylase [Hoyosella rhizosphaerae]